MINRLLAEQFTPFIVFLEYLPNSLIISVSLIIPLNSSALILLVIM